jgi:hypothetical protein
MPCFVLPRLALRTLRCGMGQPIDILVRGAKQTASPKRPRGTRQALVRELDAGPVTLRVSVLFYRRCDQQNRQLGRSWVVNCRTAEAVRFVRLRIQDLMGELDGKTLTKAESALPS